MADVGGQSWGSIAMAGAGSILAMAGQSQPLGAGSGKSYFMRARDAGRSSPNDWVAWFSLSADFAGSGYSGATPTPIGSMVAGSASVVSVR